MYEIARTKSTHGPHPQSAFDPRPRSDRLVTLLLSAIVLPRWSGTALPPPAAHHLLTDDLPLPTVALPPWITTVPPVHLPPNALEPPHAILTPHLVILNVTKPPAPQLLYGQPHPLTETAPALPEHLRRNAADLRTNLPLPHIGARMGMLPRQMVTPQTDPPAETARGRFLGPTLLPLQVSRT